MDGGNGPPIKEVNKALTKEDKIMATFTLNGTVYESNEKGNYFYKSTGKMDKKGNPIMMRIPRHIFEQAFEEMITESADQAKADAEYEERLQKQGVNLITLGGEDSTPSVGALVNAAHSDLAESYVMVSDGTRLNLELRQVKRILGDRVEIITVDNPEEQEIAVRAFNRHMSAKENAARMTESLEEYRGRDGNC